MTGHQPFERPAGRHLGELAAAVADGALGHAARDKAYAHLASCPQCRAEVEQQRALKSMLASLPEPGLPTRLSDRLRVVPDAAPTDSVTSEFGTSAVGTSALPPVVVPASFAPRQTRRRTGDVARPATSSRGGSGRGTSGRGGFGRRQPLGAGSGLAASNSGAATYGLSRRGIALGATGGLTAFVVGLTVVAAMGQDDRDPVAPSLDAYTAEHGRSAGSLPMSDPAGAVGVGMSRRGAGGSGSGGAGAPGTVDPGSVGSGPVGSGVPGQAGR